MAARMARHLARAALWGLYILAALMLCGTATPKAAAQTLSSRLYAGDSGLTELNVVQILHTSTGALFAFTEGSTYVFDGHSFLRIGAETGLSDSMMFGDASLGPRGASLVVARQGELFVSALPTPFRASQLHFVPVSLPVGLGYKVVRSMTPFRSGMAVAIGNALAFLDLSDPATPHFAHEPAALVRANAAGIAPFAVFADRDVLWESRQDGGICAYSPQGDRCWGVKSALVQCQWSGFLPDGHGGIYARAGTLVAHLDPRRPQASIETIPDTAPGLDARALSLRLIRLADGDIATQTLHGLALRHAGAWREVPLLDDDETISSFDAASDGTLWLGLLGIGMRQFFGYGTAQNWGERSGLSSNVVWKIRRNAPGGFWIGTDGGLDFLTPGGVIQPTVERRAIQTLSAGRPGVYWMVLDHTILERFDTTSAQHRDLRFADLQSVAATPKGDVWIATGSGLYHLRDDGTYDSPPERVGAADHSFDSVVVAPDGGLWLTGDGALWHAAPGRAPDALITRWPGGMVYPTGVALDRNGVVWVATTHGLFAVYDPLGPSPKIGWVASGILPSEAICALLIDHSGNLWAGTSNGLAVRHLGRWYVAGRDAGLIGTDISNGSLYQDIDDTIWVGSSRGLSHLIRPEHLWQIAKLDVSIQSVLVNGQPYHGQTLPDRPATVEIRVGLLGEARSSAVHFRYRLTGAQEGWVDLPSDRLVYPAWPAGHRHLEIVAVDPATQTLSAPVGVAIDKAWPWWLSPWAIVLAGAGTALCVTGILKLRTRFLLRQRAFLQRAVEAQTADLQAVNTQLREAHAALADQTRLLTIQARRDALTGLLNRGAMQADIEAVLSREDAPPYVIVLVDIDHFKSINDRYGHLAGDGVLVALGRRFLRRAQDEDIMGRYGGEEYILARPFRGAETISTLRTLMADVCASPVARNGLEITVTFSAGIAVSRLGETWQSVVSRADAALYQAKETGRNRVIEA